MKEEGSWIYPFDLDAGQSRNNLISSYKVWLDLLSEKVMH